MGVLRGKIGEGVVRYWPPTNSFLLFGVLIRLCQFWWKSIKKCDRESARRRTDTHTHTDTQTQTDFIICPMLYARAINNKLFCPFILSDHYVENPWNAYFKSFQGRHNPRSPPPQYIISSERLPQNIRLATGLSACIMSSNFISAL